MARPISAEARRDVQAEETGTVFIELLTIDHPSLAEPIRVCSDAVDVTSRGDLFVALPFRSRWAGDQEGGRSVGRVEIDNISQDIERGIQSITDPPSVLLEVVRHQTPDVVEVRFANFIMRVVDRTITLVRADILIDDLTRRDFPPRTYRPGLFRGLFVR